MAPPFASNDHHHGRSNASPSISKSPPEPDPPRFPLLPFAGAVVIGTEGIDGNAHLDAVQVLPLE
ncbi:MAG: hypothetical protein H7A52_04435 [Akkermansiaceae bacterium]|nr:hypothetical protein [Akkermansiaceae bacterium]